MNFVQFWHNFITPIMFGSGNRQGVPFCTHAYVPETDPITGEEFHEREDHGHLLNVYYSTLPMSLVLTTFLMFSATENCHVHKRRKKSQHQPRALPRGSEISRNTTDNVCLEGDRKQSVRDAELMFNPNFLKWLVSKGYTAESEYVEAVLGWHHANEERGLSEEERSSLSKRFL